MTQSTSIIVQFGTDTSADAAANAHLSAEIDSRDDGRNGGETRFRPGETAYFLVYKSDNVNIDDVIASAGSIGSHGSENVEKSEDITFANTDEGRLRVPASGGITGTKWMGTSLGSLSMDGPTTVLASSEGVAVAKVTYRANALAYSITAPSEINGETDFSIVVVVVGNVTEGGD
jgi:hypothetical protein